MNFSSHSVFFVNTVESTARYFSWKRSNIQNDDYIHYSILYCRLSYYNCIPWYTLRVSYDWYTLSGRTGSALAWHSEGRVFGPHSLLQVLRYVARICIVKYMELKGYCPVYGEEQRRVNWIDRL